MMKMSKMATPPIMDPHTANILICYLLYKIDKPVQVSHLYDIAVGSNIINYFAYQDSISYLTEHNSVAVRQNEEAVDYYVLTENGFGRQRNCETMWERRIGTSWFRRRSTISHASSGRAKSRSSISR